MTAAVTGGSGSAVRTRSAVAMYWSTLSLVTTGAYSMTVPGHLDLDQVAHPLVLHQQAGQLDAVGGLGGRVDDRGLEHASRRP